MSITKKDLQRIIQEEIGLVLVSPLPITAEPRDVTDAFHPAEVVPREDAWAGGDNIEDNLDHAYFETRESNAGPHSSVSWSHDPDSLTPGEAAGVGYAACEHDLSINEGNKMNLKKMILQEAVRLIREGHGCKCGSCSRCDMKDDIMSLVIDPGQEDDTMMSPEDAFGAGYSAGQEERDVFDYTGDLSDLSPEEAIGLGHQAGLMGLGEEEHHDGPHRSESYHKVRQFLQVNPDLVDMAIDKLMEMSGSTCPKSTRHAIYDHLSEMVSSMDDHGS